MANVTTSTDIDTFLASANNAAARTNLGVNLIDTDVAHFDAAGVGGNGTPGAPYGPGQGQTAYDAGFRVFEIGENCAIGNITITSGTPTLKFRGHGSGATVGTITNNGGAVGIGVQGENGRDLTIVDLGFRTVAISGIWSIGGVGGATDGSTQAPAGGNGGTVTLIGGVNVTDVYVYGGTGGSGDASFQSGNGGVGGNVTADGPVKISSHLDVSRGAVGMDNGGGSGSQPAAGNITLRNGPDVPTPTPDAAFVHGAIINGSFFTNTYP